MATVTTFMDPGTDDTFDLTSYPTTSGSVASSTDFAKTGTHSLKLSAGAGPTLAYALPLPANTIVDSGSQVHINFLFTALPAATAPFLPFVKVATTCFVIQLKTTGALKFTAAGITDVDGTTILGINTWYDITVSYYFTNASTWQAKVYLNGVLEITANSGTVTTTGATYFLPEITPAAGANRIFYFDNIISRTGGASSSSQPDLGLVRLAVGRPFSNGTANGFTASGTPSGYGSGNAQYVNEQPLSTSNFVSVVAVGVTTEEYNIESASVVGIDISTIVDICGWLYAKALLSETASLVLNNAASNVALTSTTAKFMAFAGATAYPAGTGTDIGLITTALATTVTLYECGIIIAYISGYGPIAGDCGLARALLVEGRLIQ